MTREQFEKITSWQNETFTAATALSKAVHLKKEAEEVSIAVAFDTTGLRHEIADCLMLLAGIANKCGMTYEDVCKALDEKHEINKKRKWGKPDNDGVVHHIK